MTLEMITGLVVAVFAVIAAAFGLGHIRGTSKAEVKADQQRTEEKAAATEAVAERRVEVTKEASKGHQTATSSSGRAATQVLWYGVRGSGGGPLPT